LARIFSPDDYGTVVIITIFTALLQVFVDGGLGSALIQKKDADDVDFSTVFYTNVIQVSALCGMLYNELRLKMERNIVFEL
jgi:O-antigen/teichoic acid export membrane protein